jgi:hypothetical protein
MACWPETTEQKAVKNDHPYKQYEGSLTWRLLDEGITALVKNGDLEERTTRRHIVGYLSKLLEDSGQIIQPSQVADTVRIHRPKRQAI